MKTFSFSTERINKLVCYEDGKASRLGQVFVTHIQKNNNVAYPIESGRNICQFDFTKQADIKSIAVISRENIEVRTNFDTYSLKKMSPKIIYFVKTHSTFRILRVIINITLLVISFLYFKSYLKLVFPLVVANTIWILMAPGSINFDILGYISSYNSYPNIDDEFGVARLFFFFMPFSITESVLYYKVFHIVMGVYSLYYLLNKLIFDTLIKNLALILIVMSPVYMSLFTSCTDMKFTSLLLIKIGLMVSLMRDRENLKNLIIFSLISVITYFYRYNAIVLLPIDILFIFFLYQSQSLYKKIGTYLTVLLLAGFTFIFFGPNERVGYEAFPALYELTDIYLEEESKREQLDWLKNYVDIKRVEEEVRDRSSLIKTFYSNGYYEEDRIFRKAIQRDYNEILKSYTFFSFDNFYSVLKVKLKFFAYTLGFDDNWAEKHYFYHPFINWIYENGDFSYLVNYDLNIIPSFLSFSNQLDEFPIGWIINLEGETWFWTIVYLILVLAVGKKLRGREELLIVIFPILYLMTFFIFNHGFLLTYTYFIVIFSKILLAYYLTTLESIPFLKKD